MDIIRIRVNLKRVVPKVMRSLLVPLDIQLQDLHITLQVAVGWTNSHLYSFQTKYGIWTESEPDWMDFDEYGDRPIEGVSLREFLAENNVTQFTYLYDFGDYWEHIIQTGAIFQAKAGELYPQLTRAKGRCPPEDVGGTWGYEQYLEIMADESHPEHEESVQWRGKFDVDDLNQEGLRIQVNDVAKLINEGKLAREYFGYDPFNDF